MSKNLKISFILALGLLFVISSQSFGQEGMAKAPSGLLYKVYKLSKDTVKARTGNWITLDMRYSARMSGKDTLLFDNLLMKPDEHIKMELPGSDFKGDLYEGIRMMSPGDSAVFGINPDSLFLITFRAPQRPSTIDSNSYVMFFIHLFAAEGADKLKKTEEEALAKYLADNKITTAPTASGVYIVKSQEGDGMKVDTGCSVKLHFSVALIDGKEIFTSFTRPEPIRFEYGRRFDTPGLSEAIGMMRKGDKAKVIVPYQMAFGEKGRGALVPAYATLLYTVEIIDVISKADLEKEVEAEKQRRAVEQQASIQGEQAALDQYLKDNKIAVQPLPSGLYYIEEVKGTGTQAEAGKTVSVHYTGTLLDGKKFDSSRDRNEPISFELGKGMVIPGWDEGIALMKQGGKAKLIIPSKIGYGDRAAGTIPPYSTLVFEVELVEVK